MVCTFGQANNNLSHLAVSDTSFAVCDSGRGCVAVYDMNGRQRFTFGTGLLKHPWGILLHEDGSALVTDITTGCLYKFKMEADAKPIWICQNLTIPTGICENANGHIFVSSNRAYRIYSISAEGKCPSCIINNYMHVENSFIYFKKLLSM